MPILTWILQNWRLVAGCAIAILLYVFGYSSGADHVKHQWDLEISIHVKEALAAQVKNQILIAELEKTKNDNLEKVAALEHDIAITRVRVPKTPCTRSMPETPATGGSVSTPPETGGVPDEIQKSLDDFTAEVGRLTRDADEIVEQCRVVIDWAKSTN